MTKAEISQHLLVGLPMGFQASIIGIGVIILQIVLNQQGEQAVAAYTAAQKVEQVMVSPLNCFGMTMATYTAQNYGAGKIERIRMGVHRCMAMSLGYTAVITLIAMTAGASLVQLFGFDDAKIIGLASTYLHSTSMFYWTLSCSLSCVIPCRELGKVLYQPSQGLWSWSCGRWGVRLWQFVRIFRYLHCVCTGMAGLLCPLAISYVFTMRRMRKNMEISKRTEI